jgi:hypothetical protein
VIHLYAFATGLRSLPAAGGVGGAPLATCVLGNVTAVVSPEDEERERPQAALEHGLVVEALRECAVAVLPVRFGERFASETALVEQVAPRLERIERQLRLVAGCVEIGVRLPADDDALGELRDELGPRARDVAVARRGTPPRDDVGFLVARSDVERFTGEVQRFVDRHPELTVLCTGPWAPYSFAEAT